MANPYPVVCIITYTKKLLFVSTETTKCVVMHLAQKIKASLLQQVLSRAEFLVFSEAASTPV